MRCQPGAVGRRSCLALALLAAQVGQRALAEDVDPLWTRALAVVQSGARQAAGRSVLDGQIQDDKGKAMGQFSIQTELTGWEAGKPQRKVTVTADSDAGSIAKLKMPMDLADEPAQALLAGDSVRRLETVQLGGRSCVVFEVRGRTGQTKSTVFRTRAWVDESTAQPVKAEHVFERPGPVKRYEMRVEFAASPAGWMPSTATTQVAATFMFMDFNFRTVQRLQDWRSPPN